jgi:hypothetical protein
MDMSGCEGVFSQYRCLVSIAHSCSELECLSEDGEFGLCAEVPTGSGWASMTESRVTITFLAKHMLSQAKLLPSVK